MNTMFQQLVVKSTMFPQRNIHNTLGPLWMGRLKNRVTTC